MKDQDRIYQQVPCPYCKAPANKPCRTRGGQFTEWSHKARIDAFIDAIRGEVESSGIMVVDGVTIIDAADL